MFTDSQLQQFQQLFEPLRKELQGLKIDVAVIKVGQDDLKKDIKELRLEQNGLRIDVINLQEGQDELKAEIQSHSVLLQAHTKTLKYIKTKLNRVSKTVDIIGRRYDERLVVLERKRMFIP